MRRFLCTFIAIIFTGMFLVGCVNPKKDDKKVENTEQKELKEDETLRLKRVEMLNEPGKFPLVNEKITLTALVEPEAFIEAIDDNEFTKWYEQKTNIHIEFEEIRGFAQFEEELKKRLARGVNLPDLIIRKDALSRTDQLKYGKNGVLISLNEYIDEYSHYFNRVTSYDKELINNLKMADGNIYGMPWYNDRCYDMYENAMWINKKWLEKLDLKVPQTTNDLYNVLKAFKEDNPNGNAYALEIPLTGSPQEGTVWGFIMEAFVAHNGEGFREGGNLLMNVEEGKVTPVFTKPEWRDGLKFLNKLYSEKLIDNEALIQDKAMVKEKMNADIPLVGAVVCSRLDNVMDIKSERILDYAYAVPPLKGPKGQQNSKYRPNKYSFSFFITKTCKYPEAAYMWADGFYSEEVSMRKYAGVPGEDWVKPSEGEKGIDGEEGFWKKVIQKQEEEEKENEEEKSENILTYWGERMGPGFLPCSFHKGLIENTQNEFKPEKLLYETAVNTYKPYARDELWFPLYDQLSFTISEAEKSENLKNALYEYINVSTAQFISGTKDIETEWDAYLKELDKIGLKKWVNTLQTVYNRQYRTK